MGTRIFGKVGTRFEEVEFTRLVLSSPVETLTSSLLLTPECTQTDSRDGPSQTRCIAGTQEAPAAVRGNSKQRVEWNDSSDFENNADEANSMDEDVHRAEYLDSFTDAI